MGERCLLAASLAVLVFHPSSTIKCFKPKSSTTSTHTEKPPPKAPHSHANKVSSKSKKQDFLANSSLSTTSSQSTSNIPSSLPMSRSGRMFDVVSQLAEGEPSIGIVETIFRSGWANETGLTIEKVLKVNHSVAVLNKFEEYRESVKSRYAKTSASESRLVADGNELLRFHGSIITCSLGIDAISSYCDKKCCGVCRVITSSFTGRKGSISISLCENSWKAHGKVTTESVVNGICARQAIVMCRVIAGRVDHEHGLRYGENCGFDSLVVSTGNQSTNSEELVVLNPRAVLPCFVVIYNVN